MGWVEELRGKVVGLDTSPFIYYIEKNPFYVDMLRPFFQLVDRGEVSIVTSVVTLLETLVHPCRHKNVTLADQYRDILLNTRGLRTIELSKNIAEEAAQLKAIYNIRTPDSIHMATAINQEASFFLTNDMRLPSLPHLKVLTLDEIKTRPEYLQ